MLVEDDNNLREIYEARLLAEGYEIVSARDGEEALALAVKERPDLIIADVMMPKISGFDMLDILRSTPETKNTKVVIMTALSQAEDKTRASELGADRYLVKSQVTLEDVAKVAREVLEDSPSTMSDGLTASGPAPDPEPIAPLPTAAPAPTSDNPVAAAPVTAPTDPIADEQAEVNKLSETEAQEKSEVTSQVSDFEDAPSGAANVDHESKTSVHTKVITPLTDGISDEDKLKNLLADQDRKDAMAKAIEPIVNKPVTGNASPATDAPADPNLISL